MRRGCLVAYNARMASTHQSRLRHPTALIVLDGWGLAEPGPHNAISAADTPVVDGLWAKYPHARFDASGASVGLPEGQMGNSEIGHMAIGAGCPIATDLVRINSTIDDGSFAQNAVVSELLSYVKEHESVLHVMGLLSPGGIHSHQAHLYALLQAAKQTGLRDVAIHAFLDGRDTPPQSAVSFLQELEQTLDNLGIGHIASLSGRYYAMDRDQNWGRITKAEYAVFDGIAEYIRWDKKPSEVVTELYANGALDEHVSPIVFHGPQGAPYGLGEYDGLFFFNFRPDRARQLAERAQ